MTEVTTATQAKAVMARAQDRHPWLLLGRSGGPYHPGGNPERGTPFWSGKSLVESRVRAGEGRPGDQVDWVLLAVSALLRDVMAEIAA